MGHRAAASRSLAGVGTALLVEAALRSRPPGGAPAWERTNHRGATVSLASGPALAVAAGATASLPPLAALVAAGGAAAVGRYDDVVGARPDQRAAKGFRGHLSALRHGRLTAGGVKVAGIGASALAAVALLPERRTGGQLLADAAVVAGAANLLNLLDLRPGRALKAGLAASCALHQPGPAAAALALLPGDLRERAMLGDAGANALGAVLGLALLDRRPAPRDRLAALAGLVALTAASEVVSFTRVIEAVPPLRWADRLGRRA